MNLRGPKAKISRRLGIAITEKSQKYLDRRPYKPGQHGPTARAGKKSVYATQLLEKQRLRAQYNVSERQMARYFERASRSGRPTGQVILELLESRLDAVVYRARWARSIFAARQYCAHRHILVNGRVVSIPSMQLKPGDVVEVREKSRELAMFRDPRLAIPVAVSHLEVESEALKLRVLGPAQPAELPIIIDIGLVVEYYSR